MTWTMPPETAPQDRIWMAFPREGETLGTASVAREEGYAAWSAVANQIAAFQPVSMVVDPSEVDRARRMLSTGIEILPHVLDEFWMRDHGPTFVHAADGSLAAIDWIFNGWGAQDWALWENDQYLARFVAEQVGAPLVPSLLVNEGGGFHVDGAGTILLTETVQLDPDRNPFADKARIEAEFTRTLGTSKAIWLPRGLTRDYDAFGTRGHVDIVAACPSPGTILLHAQPNPEHPDHRVIDMLRAGLEGETAADGTPFEIIDLPGPEILKDAEGFVDYSYINHLVINEAVIACSFGEPYADKRAREILAHVYPGREVLGVEARPLFARGGGIHCITQQQPKPLKL